MVHLNAGQVKFDDCPKYLLLYYRQHLELDDRPLDNFMELCENG
jgi:hypothetical protein